MLLAVRYIIFIVRVTHYIVTFIGDLNKATTIIYPALFGQETAKRVLHGQRIKAFPKLIQLAIKGVTIINLRKYILQQMKINYQSISQG